MRTVKRVIYLHFEHSLNPPVVGLFQPLGMELMHEQLVSRIRAIQDARSEVPPVSYTHLTLPTIYSV